MFIAKIKETIVRQKMLRPRERVLVALSGGPDSVALLCGLIDLRKEFSLSLCIAHLNHMIRTPEAEQDVRFVQRLAKRLKVPIRIGQVNVPRLAKVKKCSLEEAGRLARYKFFTKTAKKVRTGKIALGHNSDDVAETVLMHIIRGSGLAGLVGIPAIRQEGKFTIIRPLIEVSRDDILDYLKEKKADYRTDFSNLDRAYLRNKIRHQLLPFLEKEFNPNIRTNLNNLAKLAKDDSDYMSLQGKEALNKITGSLSAERISIDLEKFTNLHSAVQKQAARSAIAKLKGDIEGVGYEHWQEVERLKVGKKLDLPGNIRLFKSGGKLIITRAKKRHSRMYFRLEVPGIAELPFINETVKAEIIKGEHPRKLGTDKRCEYFDLDKIKAPLRIRFRRPGDRFMPLGMSKYRKLKDFFIDEKIPPDVRDEIPLIMSGEQIIWIAGVRMSEAAKITPKTRKILKLSLGKSETSDLTL